MLLAGGMLQRRGLITLGTVFLLFQYTQVLRRPIELIAEQLQELQRAAAGAGRLRTLLDAQPTLEARGHALLPGGARAVDFEGVEFRYADTGEAPRSGAGGGDRSGRPVLRDVNLTIAPGGSSGSSGTPAAARPRSHGSRCGWPTRPAGWSASAASTCVTWTAGSCAAAWQSQPRTSSCSPPASETTSRSSTPLCRTRRSPACSTVSVSAAGCVPCRLGWTRSSARTRSPRQVRRSCWGSAGRSCAIPAWSCSTRPPHESTP